MADILHRVMEIGITIRTVLINPECPLLVIAAHTVRLSLFEGEGF